MPFAKFYPLTPIEEVLNINGALRVGVEFGGNQLDVWQYDNSHTPVDHPMKGKARLLACGPPRHSRYCYTRHYR